MASEHPFIRTRLSGMMFLEFFLWASWYMPIGGYLNSTLQFSGPQIGWIYATTALGAMISPLFVGFIADRLFATERVLGVLHLIGAACLFLSARQTTFAPMMTLLMINALCFMPTLALVNSLAFRNIDDPDKFSWIAVWGTIGWITSLWLVELLLGGAEHKWFFHLAAGGGVAMGLYSFTLPHTPPKGAEESGGDVLGLRALGLLREPSFLVFAVCAFLISIPLTFYFQWGVAFLLETDRPLPTLLTTLSQFSEIFVMIVMPWFIARIGLKYVIVVGMAAWAVRYLCFSSLSFPLIILGLLVHGFCYCFVFVASFIYVDKRAPKDLSASAQSFLAFLMWGVGMFVGTQLAGYVGDRYPPETIAASIESKDGVEQDPSAPLPDWSVPVEDGKPVVSLAERLGSEDDDRVALSLFNELPEADIRIESISDAGELIETREYAKEDLLMAFKNADEDANGVVTRPEWRKAQAHVWPPIWLWPFGLAAVVCLLFCVGGRDVKQEEPGEGKEEEASSQQLEQGSSDEAGGERREA